MIGIIDKVIIIKCADTLALTFCFGKRRQPCDSAPIVHKTKWQQGDQSGSQGGSQPQDQS